MTSLPVAITSCDSAAPVLSVRPIAASVTIATVNATNLALTMLSTPYWMRRTSYSSCISALLGWNIFFPATRLKRRAVCRPNQAAPKLAGCFELPEALAQAVPPGRFHDTAPP